MEMNKAGLFFEDVLISTVDAPGHVLAAEQFESHYNAVLKKRFGRITADDFLKNARRFVVLCNKIYGDSKIELWKDRSVPIGSACFLASQGTYEGDLGTAINISQITVDMFHEIFAHSVSLVLLIKPMTEREDIRNSFSQIKWTRGRPRTIFVYSQDGGKYDKAGKYHRGPLHDLLIRKMFYLPCVAPSINFSVKFGIGAKLDEAEGKLF